MPGDPVQIAFPWGAEEDQRRFPHDLSLVARHRHDNRATSRDSGALHMATIGLSEAAKLTGTARSTLYRAIKAGRLSATIGPNGAVRIDPAELERAFPIKTERDSHATLRETTRNVARPAELVARVAELEARLAERDERLTEARDQIADLRRRLDGEAEERRRLTAVLADRSTVPPAPPRRWLSWRRRA